MWGRLERALPHFFRITLQGRTELGIIISEQDTYMLQVLLS